MHAVVDRGKRRQIKPTKFRHAVTVQLGEEMGMLPLEVLWNGIEDR